MARRTVTVTGSRGTRKVTLPSNFKSMTIRQQLGIVSGETQRKKERKEALRRELARGFKIETGTGPRLKTSSASEETAKEEPKESKQKIETKSKTTTKKELKTIQSIQKGKDLTKSKLNKKQTNQKKFESINKTKDFTNAQLAYNKLVDETNKKLTSYETQVSGFNKKYSRSQLTPRQLEKARQEERQLVRLQSELQKRVSSLEKQRTSVLAKFVRAQKDLEQKGAQTQKDLEFRELSKGLGIDLDARFIEDSFKGPQFEVPKSNLEVTQEILAGKKIKDRTSAELFRRGRPGEAITKYKDKLESEFSQNPDIGKGLKLFTVSTATPFFQIAEAGGRILAPTLQKGDLKKSGQLLGETSSAVGSALAYTIMHPGKTLVGTTKKALDKPISFTGETLGATALFNVGGAGATTKLIGSIKKVKGKIIKEKPLGKQYKKITKEQKRQKDYERNFLTDSRQAQINIENIYKTQSRREQTRLANLAKQESIYSDYAKMIGKIEKNVNLTKARKAKIEKLSPEEFYKIQLKKQRLLEKEINKEAMKLIKLNKPRQIKTIKFKDLKKQRQKELIGRNQTFYDNTKLTQFGKQYNQSITKLENKSILKEIDELKFKQDLPKLKAEREFLQSQPKAPRVTSLFEVKQTASQLRKNIEFIKGMDKRKLAKQEAKEKAIFEKELQLVKKRTREEFELGLEVEKEASKRQLIKDIKVLTKSKTRKKIVTAKDIFKETPDIYKTQNVKLDSGKTMLLQKTITKPKTKTLTKVKSKQRNTQTTPVQDNLLLKSNTKLKKQSALELKRQRQALTQKTKTMNKRETGRSITLIKTMSKTKTAFGPTKIKQNLLPKQQIALNLKPLQKPIVKQKVNVAQKQIPLLSQAQGISQAQQLQKTINQTKTRSKTKIILLSKPKPLIKKAKKVNQKSQQKSINKPAYNVYVRQSRGEKGKVGPQLVAQRLPKNMGINRGTKEASRYTQRTVQLKRVGNTSIADEPLNKTRFNEYRVLKPKSKIKRKDINLVEKSKHAIDTYEEKQGIPYKAQKLKRQKALLYNKKKQIVLL